MAKSRGDEFCDVFVFDAIAGNTRNKVFHEGGIFETGQRDIARNGELVLVCKEAVDFDCRANPECNNCAWSRIGKKRGLDHLPGVVSGFLVKNDLSTGSRSQDFGKGFFELKVSREFGIGKDQENVCGVVVESAERCQAVTESS